jgi:hypothetical protein
VSQSQMPLPSRSMLISTLVSLVTLNSDPMRETLAAHHKTKHETYKLLSQVMKESKYCIY